MKDLIDTIYTHDRHCKSVTFNGLTNEIEITVDCISRIRDPSGEWNFYTQEDIDDGILVFSGIQSFSMIPQGVMPNDFIYLKKVKGKDKKAAQYCIFLGHCDDQGNVSTIEMNIISNQFYLKDPKKPLVQIKK